MNLQRTNLVGEGGRHFEHEFGSIETKNTPQGAADNKIEELEGQLWYQEVFMGWAKNADFL